MFNRMCFFGIADSRCRTWIDPTLDLTDVGAEEVGARDEEAN